MKLVRFENGGVPVIGALKDGGIVDLVAAGSRWSTIRAIAGDSDEALFELRALVDRTKPSFKLSEVKLLAPIERPGKYLAIGMNYAKHLEEADKLGVARAPYQTWFNKQTTCISGPYDEIEPGVTEKLDYEVELGVVIGMSAKCVSEEEAPRHVFGYFVANDVSARDWQFHTPTFTMGKSFDTHGPIGPWIVTADEIADPHALELRCFVNGEIRQRSNTGQMIHSLWAQIAYLSTAFTLETGDLIASGTPEGVGVGMVPQSFLRSGDVVRCEIDGVGVIENRVADI
ncbi:fumarylacetoacetate hydrolase family protein [uncultured Caballeronia sp.]|uniref:fumarylacetoacetate hydrolase family protein n=1 Tax=uncultured Caballeronia sp. TaxID=1827198 RepID=UPI0035CC846D